MFHHVGVAATACDEPAAWVVGEVGVQDVLEIAARRAGGGRLLVTTSSTRVREEKKAEERVRKESKPGGWRCAGQSAEGDPRRVGQEEQLFRGDDAVDVSDRN